LHADTGNKKWQNGGLRRGYAEMLILEIPGADEF